MNTQERSILDNFLNQLQQIRGVNKDPEAEKLIRQAFERQPDAPYLVVQRTLLLSQALDQAKARLAELEQLQAETGRGFLDAGASGWQSSGGQPSSGGPTGNRPGGQSAPYAQSGPYAQPPQYAQPGTYSQPGPYSQPAPYGQPGPYGQPAYAPPGQFVPAYAVPAGPAPSAFGGFLGQAAATAAGVAGGAFLFEGIEHLLGGGGHPGASFVEQGPGAFPTEEVTVNNYYYPEEETRDPEESRSEDFSSYTADNPDPGIDDFSDDDDSGDDQDFV